MYGIIYRSMEWLSFMAFHGSVNISIHPMDPGGHCFFSNHIWGVSKNRGLSPKMDGFYNGKPYLLMDDLEVHYPLFSGNIHI